MSKEDDKLFIRNFSIIIILLVVFTIAMALIGNHFNTVLAPAENPSRVATLEKRLQSPAAVYTGSEAPAATPVAAADSNTQAPSDESTAEIDGAAIYQSACIACHSTGAAGAPKLEAADWTDRLTQGEETLVDHAINGLNAMPPKGGQMQLSDAEVRAAVQYMLAQL